MCRQIMCDKFSNTICGTNPVSNDRICMVIGCVVENILN